LGTYYGEIDIIFNCLAAPQYLNILISVSSTFSITFLLSVYIEPNMPYSADTSFYSLDNSKINTASNNDIYFSLYDAFDN
jgi:hypothetical protein